jgi:hypothetical protein
MLAAQEACTPEEWMQVCALAKADALDQAKLSARIQGRNFLQKALIPVPIELAM